MISVIRHMTLYNRFSKKSFRNFQKTKKYGKIEERSVKLSREKREKRSKNQALKGWCITNLQILIYREIYIFARDSICHPAGHNVSFRSSRHEILSLRLCLSSRMTFHGDAIESRPGFLQNDTARL